MCGGGAVGFWSPSGYGSAGAGELEAGSPAQGERPEAPRTVITHSHWAK